MRALVLLAHADPSVAPKYIDALRAVGLGADADFVLVNNFVPGKLSSAYYDLAAQCRRGDSILDGVIERFHPPRPLASYGVVVVASFSAGYALWSRVLALPRDASRIDAVVGIDSWHAGFDADHTASDAQLAPLLAFALSAREGPRVCWLGHSDVETPQKDYRDASGRLVSAYASTTQVARELERLAGGTGGGFRIDAYDVDKDQTKEHGHALTVWGPAWLAAAVQEAINRKGGAVAGGDPIPVDAHDPGLGLRALARASNEMLLGHGEDPPGSNAGHWIATYFAGCERGGKPLPISAGDWCAASASWTAFSEAAAGTAMPHRWRAAVVELWRDACELGTARSAADVRAGLYVPQPGDLWIGVRGGAGAGSGPKPDDAFAPTQGKGHVGRFVTSPDASGNFPTLDGNHGAGWARVQRNIHDPAFVGVISYGGVAETPSAEALEIAARLLRLQRELAEGGHEGLDALPPAPVA